MKYNTEDCLQSRRWALKEIELLRQLVDTKRNWELAELFNVSVNCLKSVLRRNGIRRKLPPNKKELEFKYEYPKGEFYKHLKNPCKICISHHCNSDGYISYTTATNKRDKLHRIIWKERHGNIPKGKLIRHACDNPACCEITHLELGTDKDNSKDRHSRNRTARGEEFTCSKLTNDQVKEIKEILYANRKSYKKGSGLISGLADQFNVTLNNILCIKNNKTWTHIKIEGDNINGTKINKNE